MKNFIEKLEKRNLVLIKSKKGLTLKKKNGKLTKVDIKQLEEQTDILDFIKQNKDQLLTYLTEHSVDVEQKNTLNLEEVAGIHKLTPLQEGMLFHSLYDTNSKAYKEQLIVDFPEGIDVQAFKTAWAYVMKSHTTLRSSIIHDRLSIPVQCVYHHVEMPILEVDFSEYQDEIKEQKVSEFLMQEEERILDFDKAPLMFVALLKLTNTQYKMVWTFHHIILDGWSMSIVMEEFLLAYEDLVNGVAPKDKKVDNYEDLIKYINARDKYEDDRFWKTYLQGVEAPTLLPFLKNTSDKNKDLGLFHTLVLAFDQKETAAIRDYTLNKNITVNTFFQGVWSFLLSQYTGNKDVTFGVTVSGRPLELDDVEKRVGLYINTLPLRSKVDGEQKVADWFSDIQQGQITAREHQYSELSKILKSAGKQGELFNSILVFENYPIRETLNRQDGSLKVDNVQSKIQANSLFTITVGMSDQIKLNLKYNDEQIDLAYVEAIRAHFKNIIDQLVIENKEYLGDLTIITQAEKDWLLSYNNRTTNSFSSKTVVDLFKKQVDFQRPEKKALKYGSQLLTYKTLDEQTNQLAHYLKSLGVQKNDLICTCFQHPMENIIAILGIMKAGAAYVPIDASLPKKRIKYVLDDTKSKVVLSDQGLDEVVATTNVEHLIRLEEEWPIIQKEPASELDVNIYPSDLLYVIYTSGSTGTPKGVMVCHENLTDYISGLFNAVNLETGGSFGLMSTLSADLGNTILYGALLSGGLVHLFSGEELRDAVALHDYFEKEQIDCIKLVPSHWSALEVEGQLLLPRKMIIFGGEELSVLEIEKIKAQDANLSIVNHYGPTETTIGKLLYQVERTLNRPTVPIGQPFSETQIYIVHPNLSLCPKGVTGELLIGGAGVARGYLNRPDLTESRFIANPFSRDEESKLYRTGDLVRMLPDGHIEFKGRIDDQVKINGYRIEPGEVQAVIKQCPIVTDCVVLVKKEEEDFTKVLTAYVVPDKNYDQEKIDGFLRTRLPEYMIPSTIVEIERIPLTSNGKVDRKALFEIAEPATANKEIVSPRNDIEKGLVEIWKGLLKKEDISIHDNFFELGGDSIVSIQLVSRVKRLGYRLKPRDLFQHQTIARLAKVIESKEKKTNSEQGILSGDCALLPIQQRFFAKEYPGMSHFNQSVLLGVNKSVDEGLLEKSLVAIVNQHDALRFTYKKEGESWRQIYGDKIPALSIHDLAHSDHLEADIASICQNLQQSLSIEEGELVKAALIKTPGGEKMNRLFIVIHHLAVDGVSWRILIDQLESCLNDLTQGKKINLGLKTSSYREWVNALKKYAQTSKVEHQLKYWSAVSDQYQALPTDKTPERPSTFVDKKDHVISLNETLTTALLKKVNKAYNTEINDILLAALAKTINNWANIYKVVIGLEGHGRENLFKHIDCSATVGWFTNLYPVCIETEEGMDFKSLIASTKEQLRAIPEKGMGYGLLRYLHDSPEKKAALEKGRWEILFNYLGQSDNIVNESTWFEIAKESKGKGTNDGHPFDHKLELVSIVADGRLDLTFKYSDLLYEATTIEILANEYVATLTQIIEHCLHNKGAYTPTDIGLKDEINIKELDQLTETLNDKAVEGDEILKF